MPNKDNTEIIAFYNVENLFNPDPTPVHKLDPTISGLKNWDERKYNNKLLKIAHVFRLILETEGELPMLIGLSEVQGQKPLEELIQLEPFDGNYGIVHYESMDERGVDVALLYDKAKVEIISSEPFSYFFTMDNGKSEYYDTTRDVLFCKVKCAGVLINLFVLHLPSKRERDVNKFKRDYILADLNAKISELLKNDKDSVIVMGDFNENPDEDNLNNFLYDGDFNKILLNPYIDLFKNGVFSTFHYKSGLLFDQIILSPKFFDEEYPLNFQFAKAFNHQKLRNWDKKSSERPFRTYAGTRYLGGYSDHFPVISVFSRD